MICGVWPLYSRSQDQEVAMEVSRRNHKTDLSSSQTMSSQACFPLKMNGETIFWLQAKSMDSDSLTATYVPLFLMDWKNSDSGKHCDRHQLHDTNPSDWDTTTQQHMMYALHLMCLG